MNLPELVCLMRIVGMGIVGILVNTVLATCVKLAVLDVPVCLGVPRIIMFVGDYEARKVAMAPTHQSALAVVEPESAVPVVETIFS
jgi:hypothetical protein